MKIVKTILALLALVASLVAAWHWYSASQSIPVPVWPPDGDHRDPAASVDDWIAGMMRAAADSADKNKTAARWTAAAIVFTGMAAAL